MPGGSLIPGGRGLTSKHQRQLSRSLDRLSATTALEIAHVCSGEALAAARVEAIGAVTTVALIETANLATAEVVLAQRTPHAAGRLQYVADTGTMAMAQVVARMDRSLR